jgi:hypothetical protein
MDRSAIRRPAAPSPGATSRDRHAPRVLRWAWIAVSMGMVLCVAALGVWVGRSLERSRRPASGAPEAGGLVAPERPEVHPSSWRGRITAAAAVPSPSASTIERPEAPTVPGEHAIDDSPHSEKQVAIQLGQRFQADSGATPQSRGSESVLRDALSHGEGVSLDALECRSTTCRAVVTFQSTAVDHHFIRQTFLDAETRLALNMGVIIPVRDERGDGTIVATMYFVTPDHPFP